MDAGWRFSKIVENYGKITQWLVIISPNNPLTHYQNRPAISSATTTDSTIFWCFMVFSISVVASLPGSDLTVTVEAKQLQADGRGSIRMLGGGLGINPLSR